MAEATLSARFGLTTEYVDMADDGQERDDVPSFFYETFQLPGDEWFSPVAFWWCVVLACRIFLRHSKGIWLSPSAGGASWSTSPVLSSLTAK
jgi:hypothetical protein